MILNRSPLAERHLVENILKTSLRTINHFTGTDGKQFYAFEGKGFDQAHPKSNPTNMDKRNYRMNIFNGRLYEGIFYQN